MESPVPAQSSVSSDVELLMWKDRPLISLLSIAINLLLVIVFYSPYRYINCAWVVLVFVLLYWLKPKLNRLQELCFAGVFLANAWYTYKLLPWGDVDHFLLDWLFQSLCILLSGAYIIMPRDYMVIAQLVLLAYPIRDDTLSIIVPGFTVAWLMVLIIETTMNKTASATQLAMNTCPLLRTHMVLFTFYFGCLVIYKTVSLYGYGIKYEPAPVKEEEPDEEEEQEQLVEEEPPEQLTPEPEPVVVAPPPPVRKPKILAPRPGPIDIVIGSQSRRPPPPKPAQPPPTISVLTAAVNEQLNGISFAQIFKKEKNDRNSS